MKIKKVAVLGLGKVGCLVAKMLNKTFEVMGVDKETPAYKMAFDFKIIKTDLSKTENLQFILSQVDAVVSALPYFLNAKIAKVAHEFGIHYFDLTEDVNVTNSIKKLSATSKGLMAPQCGLAPGLIGIVGHDLTHNFTKLRDLELRVGALPRYPNGQLAYSFTWSPSGVINEYLNDAEVIHNGSKKKVPSLDGLEHINIEGQEFEAFSTSGGLGTLCDTLEGKVDTLNYKTIRYPGHAKLMRFLMYELILKDQPKLLEKILSDAKPPVDEDVVYVYAIAEGWQDHRLYRKEYFKAFYPKEIDGEIWRAISWTTAASLSAVVELAALGKLPKKGFLKQESIELQSFLETKSGKLFVD